MSVTLFSKFINLNPLYLLLIELYSLRADQQCRDYDTECSDNVLKLCNLLAVLVIISFALH